MTLAEELSGKVYIPPHKGRIVNLLPEDSPHAERQAAHRAKGLETRKAILAMSDLPVPVIVMELRLSREYIQRVLREARNA